MKKETDRKVLQVKRLTNKVQGLDIKGQGCDNDCAVWGGNSSKGDSGCDYVLNARTTKLW